VARKHYLVDNNFERVVHLIDIEHKQMYFANKSQLQKILNCSLHFLMTVCINFEVLFIHLKYFFD